MRKPEIPDAYADPLLSVYHQTEAAMAPEETMGKRFAANGARNLQLINSVGVIVSL
jgi:hypothetical protein